jgi:hypothetical protein
MTGKLTTGFENIFNAADLRQAYWQLTKQV